MNIIGRALRAVEDLSASKSLLDCMSAFLTLNRGLRRERMACWHCCCSREVSGALPGSAGCVEEPGCRTRKRARREGPPPGEGRATAAASKTSATSDVHAVSSSTLLTCATPNTAQSLRSEGRSSTSDCIRGALQKTPTQQQTRCPLKAQL